MKKPRSSRKNLVSISRTPSRRVLETSIPSASALLCPSFRERIFEARQRHAHLGHIVAGPDGGGMIVDRFEVDGHRERRADLVLAPVALADRLGIVVLGTEVGPQLMLHVLRQMAHGLLAG